MLPFFSTMLAKTLRFKWSGIALPPRAVVMFWHGKMFGGWYAVRSKCPIALVSKSKDGRILSRVLASWGYQLARGSAGKKGMEALEEAMEEIRTGNADILAITPDGPRGPRHEFKRGAFIAARELGVPLIMLHIESKPHVTLAKSWDRFELPMPFSSVLVRVEEVNISDFPSEFDEQQMWLERTSRAFAA